MMKIVICLFLLSNSLFAGKLPTTQEPNQEKPESTATWYLGFGPAFLSGLNIGGTGVGVETARVWPVSSAELRLAFDFAMKSAAYMGSTGIGVHYFILEENITPYVGAEFGFGLTKAEGDVAYPSTTNGGFMLAISVGAQVFRESNFHLDLGLKGSYLLRDTLHGTPQVYVLHVGLVF